MGPFYVRLYPDEALRRRHRGDASRGYCLPGPYRCQLTHNNTPKHEARFRKTPGLCLSMDTPVDLTRGKTRVGFMRKCPQLAVSFTARQTFAKLTGVDEKRELMGAHTTLSRKILPRYENPDASIPAVLGNVKSFTWCLLDIQTVRLQL